LEAIQRAALLARETGARLYVVHVSSAQGVRYAAHFRNLGIPITIETCPHYLALNEKDLQRIGALAKCSPPLRSAAEQSELWREVAKGDVDVISSDHSPSTPDLKTGEDFFAIWGGIAGVQSTLHILLSGGLEPQRIAQLTAAGPANIFNIQDKGAIRVGFDADCTIIDPAAEFVLERSDLEDRNKLNPYVGRKFRGVVEATLVRGCTPLEGTGRLVRPRKETDAAPGSHA